MKKATKTRCRRPATRPATGLVLRNIDKARLALGEAKTMQEAKQIVDMAAGAEV